MSALAKLFPNATARPWEMVAVAVVGEKLTVDEAGVKQGVEVALNEDNILLTLHTVNTFDARDEVIEAVRAERKADRDAPQGITDMTAYRNRITEAMDRLDEIESVKP